MNTKYQLELSAWPLALVVLVLKIYFNGSATTLSAHVQDGMAKKMCQLCFQINRDLVKQHPASVTEIRATKTAGRKNTNNACLSLIEIVLVNCMKPRIKEGTLQLFKANCIVHT